MARIHADYHEAKKQNVSARQQIDVSTEKHWENVKSMTRSVAQKWRSGKLLWILKPSGCTLWVSSIHQMGKFVPMIDWQVFQIRAVLGMECWLAVMRQSELSPWSRQKMLWHNLAAGLTEDEKSFRGQKVCSIYWHEQQSAQINMEIFSVAVILSWTLFRNIRWFRKTIGEAFRSSGFTPDPHSKVWQSSNCGLT